MKNRGASTLGRMWRGWLFLGLVILGSAIAGAQPALENRGKVILSEPERAWVQQHPVVYWGVNPQCPPLSSLDRRGQMIGIDVEIIKLIAQRTGLRLQLVPTSTWSETLSNAAAGKIDFVGGIAKTDEREHLLGLQFTEIYCKFPTAIITRKDMPFMTLMRQLEHQPIVMPRDYAWTEEFRKQYPDVHPLFANTEEECLLMVSGNKIDATIINLASAEYIVHMRGLSNLKISGFTRVDFFLSLAVRRGAPELRSILQKGLDSINPLEKEDIYADFITLEVRREINWKAWRDWAIYTALAGIAVVTVVLFWNRSLAREIRRRKVAETALLQARDELDVRAQELHRRAGEMEAVNQQLTWANKDLESFSYSVSHDLKAPVRRLRTFTDLLERNAGSRFDATGRQYLKAMQSESQQMYALINALLGFSRVGQAQLHLAPVNLEELTWEVVRDVELETKGREIAWKILPLPTVECDRGLIKQVLANLLGNAVKFTRHRTPAVIEVGVLPQKAGDREVVFYVKDNGAGFEKDQANALFEPFRRLHSQEEFEGSGIGLTNVKRIVQKHGGYVCAEGEVDKGATFYFSLSTSITPK